MDALSDELQGSEFDFEGALTTSHTLLVRKLPTDEQLRLERTLMRGILSEVIPLQTTFRPVNRFNAWAREAFEFYRLNIGRTAFTQLFSADLHYDLTLQPLLQIETSTKLLQQKLEEYANVKLTGVIAPKLPKELTETALLVAGETIEPALKLLASELRAMEKRPPRRSRAGLPILQEIELDTSYRDKRGVIKFGLVGDKLALEESEAVAGGSPNYKSLVDRALSRLRSSRTLTRISNLDPILSDLFREYALLYKQALDDDNALALFAIGQEIDSRLIYNQQQADEDEKLDGDALAFILPFMSAHGLYIQSLNIVVRATSDIDRVNQSFSRLSPAAKPIPMTLLRTLSETDALFTPRTQAALTKLSEAVNQPQPPTDALSAMSMGALRGSMRTMGGYILDKVYHLPIDAAESVAKDALKDAIKEVAKRPEFNAHIHSFFLTNAERLIELAHNVPLYFSWLRPFVTLLKGG